MTDNEAIIESWKRQASCLNNLTTLIDKSLMNVTASEDGWTVAYHLCHIHESRSYWLYKATGEKNADLKDLYHQVDEEWFPSEDLGEITAQLRLSEQAISKWMTAALTKKTESGPYDHPVLFLQHMIWHEGYHFALLTLALRRAGVEPTEEWEESNIWGLWRNPE